MKPFTASRIPLPLSLCLRFIRYLSPSLRAAISPCTGYMFVWALVTTEAGLERHLGIVVGSLSVTQRGSSTLSSSIDAPYTLSHCFSVSLFSSLSPLLSSFRFLSLCLSLKFYISAAPSVFDSVPSVPFPLPHHIRCRHREETVPCTTEGPTLGQRQPAASTL